MRWKKQPAMEQKIDEYLKSIQGGGNRVEKERSGVNSGGDSSSAASISERGLIAGSVNTPDGSQCVNVLAMCYRADERCHQHWRYPHVASFRDIDFPLK